MDSPKPLAVPQANQSVLIIPVEMEPQLLPFRNISIRAMLDFDLPVIQVVSQTHNVMDFFKKEPPNNVTQNMLTQLTHLPIPPKEFVDALAKRRHQAQLQGYRSIWYSHLAGTDQTCYLL